MSGGHITVDFRELYECRLKPDFPICPFESLLVLFVTPYTFPIVMASTRFDFGRQGVAKCARAVGFNLVN